VRFIVFDEAHNFSPLFMDTKISFTLNGQSRTVTTDPQRSLLEVLREDLQLTGTKFGCGEGQCRACTVLVNGESTPSCLTSIGDVDKQEVLTIEGLAGGDKLHPVQEAFLAEGAFQCGYCTAGMVMGVVGALKKNPKASGIEVMVDMQKHICRCCSYTKYSKAINRALAQSGKGRA
jgi:aerobic-type carbon monoxide dehydrogenase small subunit (CoxS/CutS family)